MIQLSRWRAISWASLNLEEKLAIAHQLARLGVDIIEAGFPFASPGDFKAVNKIANAIGKENGPIIWV